MSYTPYTWHTGDIITAERLNNISAEAFNNNQFFIIYNNNDVLDLTFNEIKEAFLSGKNCVIYNSAQNSYQKVYQINENNYSINYDTYSATSGTGYPAEATFT